MPQGEPTEDLRAPRGPIGSADTRAPAGQGRACTRKPGGQAVPGSHKRGPFARTIADAQH
eukprot:9333717-Alexandrium_andersonii.AAC.1